MKQALLHIKRIARVSRSNLGVVFSFVFDKLAAKSSQTRIHALDIANALFLGLVFYVIVCIRIFYDARATVVEATSAFTRITVEITDASALTARDLFLCNEVVC